MENRPQPTASSEIRDMAKAGARKAGDIVLGSLGFAAAGLLILAGSIWGIPKSLRK